MPDEPSRIEAFRKAANGGKHDEATRLMKTMEPEEIAEAIVPVHAMGELGSDRQALREAAALFVEAKTASRVISAMTTLNSTGRLVTRVGIALAAIQALTGIAAVWLALAGK